MLPIGKILHPTDYSELCRPAFDLACALARDYAAELLICHVAPPPIIAAGEGVLMDFPTGEAEQMAARLAELKPEDPGIRVTHQLLRGEPAAEIAKLAAEARVDLIVIGTHGRGGFGRLLLGSVAEGVMRQAPCPVVTARAVMPDNPPAEAGGARHKAWCWSK